MLPRPERVGASNDRDVGGVGDRASVAQEVGAGLACGVGAPGSQPILFTECCADIARTVNLVGVHEEHRRLRQAARLQHHVGPDDVREDEVTRSVDAAVDMRLARGMHNAVSIGCERQDNVEISDVTPNETEPRITLVRDEIFEAPRVRELVEHGDLRLGTLEQRIDEM